MEQLDRSPVCHSCQQPDCTGCDRDGDCWALSERDRLMLSRNLKERAIARFQRQLAEIDRRLAQLEEHN